MKYSILFYILLTILACSTDESNDNFNRLLKNKPYTVVMFIAPDCPLCMTLSTPFSNLASEYSETQFVGVISGNHYEPMEINMFATEMSFGPRIFRDYDYKVARQLNATITPEFMVLDSLGDILYQGMMDDRILSLGNYKQTWDKHYLKDALKALNSSQKPRIKKTEAIGCVLEY